MFYTIYKITNLINNKIYIGKHQTKDLNDGYMGSGKHLKHSISKHGIENFKKEILFQFDNEDEMNAKEAELVTEEFCLREDTYNLCVGGQGGFSHINRNIESRVDKNRKARMCANEAGALTKAKIALDILHKDQKWVKNKVEKRNKTLIERYGSNGVKSFEGKLHTEETKKKISEANSKLTGQRNSQFGTMWITNGQINKKIKNVDIIPEGWYKGRII